MSSKLTVLFFAAILFVAHAVPVAEEFQADDNDDVDDIIEEAERADENNVDMSDLTEEDFRDIVQHVQQNLRRAVDNMSLDQAEMAHDVTRRAKRGWSVGKGGITYQNRRGNFRAYIRPTFNRGLGFRAGFTLRF